MAREILHSDLNSFYASVECLDRPDLRGRPVAVCGSAEDRHGIVLTKNQEAKQYGIATGEPICRARAKCPDLVLLPPHFEKYEWYSGVVRKIYERYTDQIEPFGIDECWLDVTGSRRLFGSGAEIAERIRGEVERETGLTVSVGVSFTRIFAKVGSDLKKPNAVTLLPPESMESVIRPLPVEVLLGVGRAVSERLHRYNIFTVGALADTPPAWLYQWFGKVGLQLYGAANGCDDGPLITAERTPPPKSVGHGITTAEDLTTTEEVERVFSELCRAVGFRLRRARMAAGGVSVAVRDNNLSTREYQCTLSHPTRNNRAIFQQACALFRANYTWSLPIRSVTVRAISLLPDDVPCRFSLFDDMEKESRLERIDDPVDGLKLRYGRSVVFPATHYTDLKFRAGGDDLPPAAGMPTAPRGATCRYW